MRGTAYAARTGMLKSAFTRLAVLSALEWILLCQLIVMAATLAFALRLRSLPRLVHRLIRLARNPVTGCLPLFHRRSSPSRLHELADLAAAFVAGRGRCLPRSLLVMWLVHARGGSARLLVGAGLEDGRPGGHAWVESDHWPRLEEPEATHRLPVFLEL